MPGERVIADLRNDILSGRLKPGSMLPTQRQLAEQYGVAENTAWLAMSRLANDGLVVRSRGRGSFVAERNQRWSAVRRIEFVWPNYRPKSDKHSVTMHWIQAGSRVARQRDWAGQWHHLLEEDVDDLDGMIERYKDARGVVAFLRLRLDAEFVWALRRRGVPVVAVWLYQDSLMPPRPARFAQVTWDRRQQGRIAAEHLLKLGYRRIAIIGKDPSVRAVGVMDALRQHRLALRPDWFITTASEPADELRRAVRRLLGSADRPEAIACETDFMARVVEEEAIAQGLDVPGDLALVACDCSAYAEDAPVPISGVACSAHEVCRHAIEIIEQIEPGRNDRHAMCVPPVMVPLHLTVRASCGAGTENRTAEKQDQQEQP
jgi:DNA-binding LacI/PurR family transcriptional regulator